MTKKTDKQILFERMYKVTGMPLNEDVHTDDGMKLWSELTNAYDNVYDDNYVGGNAYSKDHPVFSHIKELENELNNKYEIVFEYPDGNVFDVIDSTFTLFDAYKKMKNEPLTPKFYANQ